MTNNYQRVNLSIGNWIAICGIVVVQLSLAGAAWVDMNNRVTALETRMESLERERGRDLSDLQRGQNDIKADLRAMRERMDKFMQHEHP